MASTVYSQVKRSMTHIYTTPIISFSQVCPSVGSAHSTGSILNPNYLKSHLYTKLVLKVFALTHTFSGVVTSLPFGKVRFYYS